MKKLACVLGILALTASGLMVSSTASAYRSTSAPRILLCPPNQSDCISITNRAKIDKIKKQLKILPVNLCTQKGKCISVNKLQSLTKSERQQIRNLCKQSGNGSFCKLNIEPLQPLKPSN